MNSRTATLKELAELVSGRLKGDGDLVIRAAAPIQEAGPGDITFVANFRYAKYIATTEASALVLDEKTACERPNHIRIANPYLAFAHIVSHLYPEAPLLPPGRDSHANIHEDANIDESCAIGPFCHVGRGTQVGAGSQLTASVIIGDDVIIGKNCILYPGVKVMAESRIGDDVRIHSGVVIGSDGFGFAQSEQGLQKVQQIGWVEIGDNVEIGANTTIDRGALGATRIGRGTKIDNLVQIAHNVEIGEDCIIVAQVGISGSTKLGNGVILAGQVGLIGHIELGDRAVVGAQSGVSKSIPTGKTVFGSPARDIMESKRIEASLGRLPDLLKRVRKLEEKMRSRD